MKEFNKATRQDNERTQIYEKRMSDFSHLIYDSSTNTTYVRGKLLGKGGFARCYELINVNTKKVYAGKVIPLSRLAKQHQRQKILREVNLHRDLKHKHVVAFHNCFEDADNFYIVLENCSQKSLVHVLKNRKTLTEPEVRYYTRQLVDGVKFIHEKNVIHRDLKLGNMLLNNQMEVKIGDFGLATRVDYDGEKKMTVCGTPNYIAPEVLQKKGHSFEADIWAIGCIMYALLVGRPPFETATLKETYLCIASNKYVLPASLSVPAKRLIQKCLSPQPADRPALDEILSDKFLVCGYLPLNLTPASCASAPKFPDPRAKDRPLSYAVPDCVRIFIHALDQLNINIESETESEKLNGSGQNGEPQTILQQRIEREFSPVLSSAGNTNASHSSHKDSHVNYRCAATLLDVLTACLDHMPQSQDVDFTHEPMSDVDVVWVMKWVDYSNKYGFGFQLSNNSIGVFFNDTSRIILGPDGRAVQYHDITGKLTAYSTECVPVDLKKKTTLMLYFARYMDEHLIKGGKFVSAQQENTELSWSGILYLKKWFRTNEAIVMYLSNGTFQVNFFKDHTKIILSYSTKHNYLVTFIDETRLASTHSLVYFIQEGCSAEIYKRLDFANSMLQNLVDIEGVDI